MLYKKVTFFLIIKFLLLQTLLSTFSFSTSSTINSQNGLGASAKGQSSSQQMQSQVEKELKNTTSTLNPSHSLNISNMNTQSNYLEDYKIKIFSYYKNTLLSLADKGYLTVDILNNSIKSKNHYFEKIDSFSQNIKIRPYLESLQAIKREILKTSNVAEFEIFAENTLLDLLEHFQKTEEIKIESNVATQGIPFPKIMDTIHFSGIDSNQYHLHTEKTSLPNGNLILTFGLYFIVDVNTPNIFYIYNATTKKMTHKLNLDEHLNLKNKSANRYRSHILAKNNSGNLMAVIQTNDFRIHFFDLETGLNLFPSLNIMNKRFFSKMEFIEFSDGRKVLAILDEQNLNFIDLDTGKPITDKKIFSFFNFKFEYQKPRNPLKIKDLYLSKLTHTRLNNGKTIVLISNKDELIFLDPSSGNEYYPRHKREIFNITDVKIQDGIKGKIVVIQEDQKKRSYFIDLETGQEINVITYEHIRMRSLSAYDVLPQLFFTENGRSFQIFIHSARRTINFIDAETGEDVFDPIYVDTSNFIGNIRLNQNESFVSNFKNTSILVFATSFSLFFIDLSSGKLLHASESNLHAMEAFQLPFTQEDAILVRKIEKKIHFQSIAEGIEVIPSLEFEAWIKEVKVITNPITQKQMVLAISISGEIHIIELLQTVSE